MKKFNNLFVILSFKVLHALNLLLVHSLIKQFYLELESCLQRGHNEDRSSQGSMHAVWK